MPAITEVRLKKFAPHANNDITRAFLIPDADKLLIKYGVTSVLILAHFMGQCFEETDAFTAMSENLHYSAERLHEVFKRQVPTLADAEKIAGDPEAIANVVYGGRMGNNRTGDGYKFRGGGLLDMTGKSNYAKMAKSTGLDLINHPEMARDPNDALEVALAIWQALGCNEPASRDDGDEVTQRVNGGQNGASARADATDRASMIFTEAPFDMFAPLPMLDVSDTAPASYIGAPIAPAPVPLTTLQAKQLQQQLKDKAYSPGEIDGNIHGPSTVGAVAEVQKQQGLPVTGVVDDATEDAIQDAPAKIVSDDRANETPQSLRAKGSTTILAADASHSATHGVAATGASLVGIGGVSILGTLNDQADQLKQVTDHVPGLTDKLGTVFTMHWQLCVLVVFGGVLLYLSKTLYANTRTIVAERVRKSASGEDMSH